MRQHLTASVRALPRGSRIAHGHALAEASLQVELSGRAVRRLVRLD
jgi:hypothetical protein